MREAELESDAVQLEAEKGVGEVLLLVLLALRFPFFFLLAAVLFDEVLDVHSLLGQLLLVVRPGYLRLLHEPREIESHVFDPHPAHSVHFLLVDLQPLLFSHAPRHEEVRVAPVRLELNADFGVDPMVDVHSSLLVDFSGRAGLCGFVLVPLPLRKAVLASDLNDQHLGVFPVEDDGPTDRLILLQPNCNLMGVELDDIRGILCKFEEELALILGFLVSEHLVDVVIVGLLGVVAEPAEIPEFVLGQVYDELAENALEEVALLVHAVIKVYKAGRGAGV